MFGHLLVVSTSFRDMDGQGNRMLGPTIALYWPYHVILAGENARGRARSTAYRRTFRSVLAFAMAVRV